MTMSATQIEALRRAKGFLAASGVKWAILKEDGTTEGPLDVRVRKHPPRDPNKPLKATSRGPRATITNMNDKYGWRQMFDVLQPSDVMVITAESEADAKQLGRNFSAAASDRFGKDNYITSVSGLRAELLRVA